MLTSWKSIVTLKHVTWPSLFLYLLFFVQLQERAFLSGQQARTWTDPQFTAGPMQKHTSENKYALESRALSTTLSSGTQKYNTFTKYVCCVSLNWKTCQRSVAAAVFKWAWDYENKRQAVLVTEILRQKNKIKKERKPIIHTSLILHHNPKHLLHTTTERFCFAGLLWSA